MSSSVIQSKKTTRVFHKRALAGFTLLEVAIAASLLAIGALAVFASIFRAHELGKLKRHRDQARAVLISFADQFSRLQVVDKDTATGIVSTRTFFQSTTTPTGVGLSLQEVSGDASGLQVTLGDSSTSMVTATVTRFVSEVNESDGTLNTDDTNTAAGRMLMARFDISYQINKRNFSQSLSIARSAK